MFARSQLEILLKTATIIATFEKYLVKDGVKKISKAQKESFPVSTYCKAQNIVIEEVEERKQ